MSYQLEIKDDALCIHGMFGIYEAEGGGTDGFNVSVVSDMCVNELDADGGEYLVDAGQEWEIPVKNLAELNSFIKTCEDERLWNFILGPVFKIKVDAEKNLLYMKGHTANFVIGECNSGLYVDDINAKSHSIVAEFSEGMRKLTINDKWWTRPVMETMDIIRGLKCYACVTSGGNLKVEIKDKSFVIGQKEEGGFWVNVTADQERNVYYKESWKEVVEIFGK